MVAHDVMIRGLGASSKGAAPLLLQRTDENVIGVLLQALESEQAYQAVSSSIASTRDKSGCLRLYQPVHRTFHVVVCELACDVPGMPRLDPRKIDSAGFVVRRVHRDGLHSSNGQFPQAWVSVSGKLRGWAKLSTVAEEYDRDPDPARRRVATGGAPEIARQALAKARLEDGAEDVTQLFVAPPAVCEKAGKTILFGLVPTTSAERSESPAPIVRPEDFDPVAGGKDTLKNDVLPVYLKSGGTSFGTLALRCFTGRSAARYTSFGTLDEAERSLSPNGPGGQSVSGDLDRRRLDLFVEFVRFLRVSLDAFGSAPESVALRALLAEIKVPSNQKELEARTGAPADQLLATASSALVAQTPGAARAFRFPYYWPTFSAELADRIYAQVKRVLAARLSDLQPGVPRFDEPSARYQLRAFARVKLDEQCPPRLIWSDESEPFSIVPWYENGVLPPVQIQLPDITSGNVKDLRPNVAFKMPRRLFNFLRDNSPKDLMEGNGSEGLDVGLQWICSFNISIIFVLAFILMFMFLIIFNLIFWWLPFIRICLPVPTVSRRADS